MAANEPLNLNLWMDFCRVLLFYFVCFMTDDRGSFKLRRSITLREN